MRHSHTKINRCFSLTLFVPLVEFWTVSTYLHKGSRVAVTGRITTRSFETDDGNRTMTEIVANGVDFLDPKPGNHEPREEAAPLSDDEIPF